LNSNTTNTLSVASGQLTSNVNGVSSTAVPVVVSSSNGLATTNGDVKLGGSLSAPTAIATDNTNTLAITGLGAGATSDKYVVVDASGVLKTVTPNTAGITQVTAAYTVADNDYTILINASSDFTITLPSAAANNGRTLLIRRIDGDSDFVTTLSTNVKINNTTFNTLNFGTWRLQSDGTDWYVISNQ
jgi:hypothetical protein